jgi:hypothetical protein
MSSVVCLLTSDFCLPVPSVVAGLLAGSCALRFILDFHLTFTLYFNYLFSEEVILVRQFVN